MPAKAGTQFLPEQFKNCLDSGIRRNDLKSE